MPETTYQQRVEEIDVVLVIDDNTEQTFRVPALIIQEYEETTEGKTNVVDPYAYINLPNQDTLIATQETGQWMVQATVNTILEAQRWGGMHQMAIGRELIALPARIRQRPCLYELVPE